MAKEYACLNVENGRPHLKMSSVDRRLINGQTIINGRLITEIRECPEDYPAGTLVCEPFSIADRERFIADYGGEWWDYAAGETVTRLGKVFWDKGVFTERT